MRPGFFLTPDTWHLESEHGLFANWWKYHVNPRWATKNNV